MTLHQSAIRGALIASGVRPAVISEFSDVDYMPCRSDWLLDDFHHWFFRSLSALDIRDYTPENNDCDDFTDLFCVFARILHRRTSPSSKAALPVGRLNFFKTPPTTDKHAVAWAYTSDLGLIFIEPQTKGQRLHLTVPQLNSATLCRD